MEMFESSVEVDKMKYQVVLKMNETTISSLPTLNTSSVPT